MAFKKFFSIFWAIFLLLIAIWYLLIPFCITSHYLINDKGLRQPGGSTFAFRTHRKLTKPYKNYAEKRIASAKAKNVDYNNISGTEWPLFGSMFYLMATHQLQHTWEADPSLSKVAPKVYARDTIDAAKNLVLDEGHAAWVKRHWGPDNYLKKENVFYRMMVMWAIISHHHLTDSTEDLPLLKTQAESLAAEINRSTFGILDDYPRQCYPTDVVAALAAIQEADKIIGTDHSEQLRFAIRGFSGRLVDEYGLPPFCANSRTGRILVASRGCGNSYFCNFGPMLWPEYAANWYGSYVKNFWQENGFLTGFREFPINRGESWYFDVDAGPVIGGIGFAASAFGLAATRTNNDYQRSFSLAAEMIAFSIPLANGQLAIPRLVSDHKHAPLLGEAAIVYQLSQQPLFATKPTNKGSGKIPGCVWLLLLLQLSLGGLMLWRGTRRLIRTLKVFSN